MSKEVLKKWQKKTRVSKSTFREYINLPKDQLGLREFFSEEEAKMMESCVESLPKLSLDVKCFVKGSEGIYQSECLTIDVTLTRTASSADGKEEPNGVHSNVYKFPKQEIIWLIVASREEKRVFDFAKLHRSFTEVHKEYMIYLEKPGKQEFTVYAKLDCYRGLDCRKHIIVDVQKKENIPKEPEVIDPDLSKPSLMEQMMGACKQESYSDEEVEEEEEQKKEDDKKPKEQTNGEKEKKN